MVFRIVLLWAERQAYALWEARLLAIIAGGVFLGSLLCGVVHLVWGRSPAGGEAQSWTLLVGIVLLIVAIVILAVANLRHPELSLAAVLGWADSTSDVQPREDLPEEDASAADGSDVNWAKSLSPSVVRLILKPEFATR